MRPEIRSTPSSMSDITDQYIDINCKLFDNGNNGMTSILRT